MKQALGFLGGTVFSTLIVIFAGGRSSAMIALGFFLAVSLLTGICYLAGARRLARALNAFANTADEVSVARSARKSDNGYVKPSRKAQIQNVVDTIEEYKERQAERQASRGVNPIAQKVLSDPELFGESEGKVA